MVLRSIGEPALSKSAQANEPNGVKAPGFNPAKKAATQEAFRPGVFAERMTFTSTQSQPQKQICHPERVRKLLHHIVFIAHNTPIFGCVGTVQANCVNFSQFGCYRSLGHDEPECVAPSPEGESAPIRDAGSCCSYC
jgi:hypothetical protein